MKADRGRSACRGGRGRGPGRRGLPTPTSAPGSNPRVETLYLQVYSKNIEIISKSELMELILAGARLHTTPSGFFQRTVKFLFPELLLQQILRGNSKCLKFIYGGF